MTEKITRPKCPSCGKPMIFSFCIRGAEYVCIPCAKAVGLFNNLKDIETTETADKALHKKYKEDIHYLAFKKGAATCSKCNKSGGNNCPTCKIENELKYWGKNND